MLVRSLLSIAFALFFALPAFAQLPWQFHWIKGEVLTYRIRHVTSVVETLDRAKNASTSSLEIVNRWYVIDVDSKGVATLTMTLAAMRNEQKRANGETLIYDSRDPGKSTPELRDQMSKFVGHTLAVLRIDRHGRVHDVKQGSAPGFEAEPPFVVIFPDAKPELGQVWRRNYNVALDPPHGTGEKFQAEQCYDFKKIDGGRATLAVTTIFKTLPEAVRDRIPLLQKDVQGEVVFDVNVGRLISAQLNIDKTIENHQGKGTSYHFKSQYFRELVE